MGYTLEEVAARLEIQELVARYGKHYDSGEFDQFQTLFADDALFEIIPLPKFLNGPLRGAGEIRTALEARQKWGAQTNQLRHIMSNTIFEELSADKARICTLMTVSMVPKAGGPLAVVGTGLYRDRVGLRNGRWVFTERRLLPDLLGTG